MFRHCKASLVPALILVGEIIASTWTPVWFISGLVGFTLFWLICSLLTNAKAIIRRFPRLREWLPFLDPTGGLATELELVNTHVQGKIFRLVDVAQNGVVENRTFDDCIICGPAVIAPSGMTLLREPNWVSHCGDLWYQIDDAKGRAGMITLKNCTLNRCTLDNIGIMGVDREKFMSQFDTIIKDTQS